MAFLSLCSMPLRFAPAVESAAPQAACRFLKVKLGTGVPPAFALLILVPADVMVSNDCIQQAWLYSVPDLKWVHFKSAAE